MRRFDLSPGREARVPPAKRQEDPAGTDYSYSRQFSAGRMATIEPLAPAELIEVLMGRRAVPLPPHPIPIPLPLLGGSRFVIWKQDPSVGELGRRLVLVPSLVVNGPRDPRIDTNLVGTTPVTRSAAGDFIFPADTPEADCAHTFAVVRETLTMYERLRGGIAIAWAWNIGGNTDPVTAYPRAGVTANAFYSRSQKALKFFYFTPPGAGQPLYTCRSLDIVAHETGHAVLDGLKPGWLGIGNPPQTGALHEAFGDLTAIFLALSQLDQVEAFVAITKANLHAKNYLSALAEQFGAALGRSAGLRNADNDLKLSQVSNEVHELSQVFTGPIYDILADIYAHERIQQGKVKDPAQILLEVAHKLCRLLLEAIIKAPANGATFADVATAMLTISKAQGDPPAYRTFIHTRFAVREIVVPPVPLTASAIGQMDYGDPNLILGADEVKVQAADPNHPSLSAKVPQDRSGCCGTMQLPEYARAPDKLQAELQRLGQEGEVIPEEELLAGAVAELRRAFK